MRGVLPAVAIEHSMKSSPTADPSPDGEKLVRRVMTAAATAAALLLLSCHLSWMDSPIGSGPKGTVTGLYASSAKAFDRLGFVELGMQPGWFHGPTVETAVPYLNHPSGPHFVTYACYRWFGRNERALRIPIFAVFAGSVMILWVLLRRLGRQGLVAPTLILFCTAPVVIENGDLVDAFPFDLALILLTNLAWIRFRETETRSRFVCFAITAVVATQAGWTAYLMVPLFWLDLMFARSAAGRGWMRALEVGLVFSIGLVLTVGHQIWYLGGISPFVEHLGLLLRVPIGADTELIDAASIPYLTSMGGNLLVGFGAPWLVLCGCGALAVLIRIVSRRTTRFDRVTLLVIGAGWLPLLVFWSRASTIEFWSMLAAPGMAMSGALGFESISMIFKLLGHGSSRWASGFCLLILIAVAVHAGARGLENHAATDTNLHRQRSSQLNAAFRPDDLKVSFLQYL